MRRPGALALVTLLALPLFAADTKPKRATPAPRASEVPPEGLGATELSRRITTIAAELFEAEQKAGDSWTKAETEADPDSETADAADNVLYEDVIRLLDNAIDVDPDNMRAHAMMAEVLLLKAYSGGGTYDVCSLLDAQDEAEWVTSHSAHATPADLKKARELLKSIKSIPKEAIPDPASSCGDDDAPSGSMKI